MIRIELPLHTVSEANAREHWRRKAQRTKNQRDMCRMAVDQFAYKREGRIIVLLTRLGKRFLDSDNLQSSFKACRDGVADALGVDDGSPLYTWQYAQEKSKDYGIRIEIEIDSKIGLVSMEI